MQTEMPLSATRTNIATEFNATCLDQLTSSNSSNLSGHIFAIGSGTSPSIVSGIARSASR